MKTICLTLLSILFLALSTNTLPAATQLVVDVDGDIVRPGVEYYVLPYIWALGGGLALKPTNDSCQPDVIQLPFEVNNGFPVRFWPWNSKIGFVPSSTNLNVQFTAVERCPASTVWNLNDQDEATGEYFVTGGGEIGGIPSCGNIRNWFKIEKEGDLGELPIYKLVYCPEVCPSIFPICKGLGIFYQNGFRRLALSDEPLKVVFRKVEKSSV